MGIPLSLRIALEEQLEGMKQNSMTIDAQTISYRYRNQSGKGKRLLTNNSEAIAYAASRMPATFSAVYFALEHTMASLNKSPKTLLDAGAGTGAASWAADAQLDLNSITCLEREPSMLELGKTMMQKGSTPLQKAKWINHDLTIDPISEQTDLVIASYVLNEMTPENRINTIKKLWDSSKMLLLLIEPGTPTGSSHLNEARQILLKCGAHIASPCPHENTCPKDENDWCSFSCRVNRSRLHRQLKKGEAPYEDEKFIYLAVTDEPCHCEGTRILRHPQIRDGHVMLEVCTLNGFQNVTYTKKDGDKYKQARKLKSGDLII